MGQDGASLGCNHGRLPDFTSRCQWRAAGLAPYRNFYYSRFPLISKKCYHHDEITVAGFGLLRLAKKKMRVCCGPGGRLFLENWNLIALAIVSATDTIKCVEGKTRS